MPIAYTFNDTVDGKPPGWFDLVETPGTIPSDRQISLRTSILAARDRIETALAGDPPKQLSTLTELASVAKASLIEAENPPEGAEAQIKGVLTSAGLSGDAPPAAEAPIPMEHGTLSRGGWTVKLVESATHIEFTPPVSAVAPPEEQIRLALDIARVARHLGSLYTKTQGRNLWSRMQARPWELVSKAQYLQRLLQVAEVGLTRDYAQVGYARAALSAMEVEIFLLCGFAKRRNYLLECAVYAAVASVVLLLVYAFFSSSCCDALAGKDFCRRNRSIFLVLSGSMLGMWLSIASGKVATSLEELEQVINDPIGPFMRTLFVINVAFAGTVLLASGMIPIKIGSFEFVNLVTTAGVSPMIAVLIGVLFGFSEKALPTMLAKRASDFISSLGPKA